MVGNWLRADKMLLMQALINDDANIFLYQNESQIRENVFTAASRYELMDATDNLPSAAWMKENFRCWSKEWEDPYPEAERKIKEVAASLNTNGRWELVFWEQGVR